jgi:prepilin-type N-terminal cleavage/methylation domain-containing protein
MRPSRRSKGFTLIEALVATSIMAVAIVAMFGSWSTCFKQSKNISETTEAAEIAQTEIEIAKVYGSANLPTGTYNSSTSTGTWTGAYIAGSGWVAGGTAYYSFKGTQLASSTTAGVYFSVSLTATDSSVMQGSGTSYSLQQTSIRGIVVTVTNVASGKVDFTMATNLVQGGV